MFKRSRKGWHEKKNPPSLFKSPAIVQRLTWNKGQRTHLWSWFSRDINEKSLVCTLSAALCPWYRLNIPPFQRTHLVLAVSAAAALGRWITFFKVSLNSQKIPPFSSKDRGPSDCQLGAPTRPISSQGRGKKMAVSKGNTGGKKCFMKSVKIFYNTGLQCRNISAVAGSSWRANCYFRGPHLPVSCQTSERIVAWCFLKKTSFRNGQCHRSCRGEDAYQT